MRQRTNLVFFKINFLIGFPPVYKVEKKRDFSRVSILFHIFYRTEYWFSVPSVEKAITAQMFFELLQVNSYLLGTQLKWHIILMNNTWYRSAKFYIEVFGILLDQSIQLTRINMRDFFSSHKGTNIFCLIERKRSFSTTNWNFLFIKTKNFYKDGYKSSTFSNLNELKKCLIFVHQSFVIE